MEDLDTVRLYVITSVMPSGLGIPNNHEENNFYKAAIACKFAAVHKRRIEMRLKLRTMLILIAFVSLATVAMGQTKQKTDPLIDSLFAVRDFRQVAISPDG